MMCGAEWLAKNSKWALKIWPKQVEMILAVNAGSPGSIQNWLLAGGYRDRTD